jgi:hypothetical protein
MDDLVTHRYRTLFLTYGVGGNELIIENVKKYIASRENRYREDAMYFLLVNLDHMVVRPLSGYIPDLQRGSPSPTHLSVQPKDMPQKIDECFKIIEKYLDVPSHERADVHAVMSAINAGRKELRITLWRTGG